MLLWFVFRCFVDLSVPVHKDDTCDEESYSYGKEVCNRHVVRMMLRHTVQSGPIKHGVILPSKIIPAAVMQCVVTVVSIVHHCVREVALGQTKKQNIYYLS